MKKLILTPDNPNGIVEDLTAEELTQVETNKANVEAERVAEETAIQEQATLKASAKAKLIAGEALTAEEADTIVL